MTFLSHSALMCVLLRTVSTQCVSALLISIPCEMSTSVTWKVFIGLCTSCMPTQNNHAWNSLDKLSMSHTINLPWFADICMLPSDASDETKSVAFKIMKIATKETGSKMSKEMCTLDLHHAEEEVGTTVTLKDVNEILHQSHLISELVTYLRKFLKTEPLFPLLEFKLDEFERKQRTKISFDDAVKELQECTHPSLEVSTVTRFVCG